MKLGVMSPVLGGLTLEQIAGRNLPVPQREMVPVSIEEQLVCFADKFFSKTHPEREKTWQEANHALMKFGGDTAQRFKDWAKIFE